MGPPDSHDEHLGRVEICKPALILAHDPLGSSSWQLISNHGISAQDPELYSEIGDCVIYLYAKGCSQRSPPFRVSLQRMYEMHCGRVFSLYHTKDKVQTGTLGTSQDAAELGAYEIYIPAPTDYTRENSFRWHLTTRNFFAFLLNKPLVGTHLGHALVDLQDRLDLFRTETVDNFKDFAAYLESSGYLNFGHHADYALAVLHYAEHFQRRELWIDAFCHCVGMCDILGSSLEFEASAIRRVFSPPNDQKG
jgi:hypothetical protein